MKLKLERKWPKVTYCIGRLYVDGLYECNTLEDCDRGLNQTDHIEYIMRRKVANETAIPKGIYVVSMNTISPKYSASPGIRNYARGKSPACSMSPDGRGCLSIPARTPFKPPVAFWLAGTARKAN